jgi:hypothetical protein
MTTDDNRRVYTPTPEEERQAHEDAEAGRRELAERDATDSAEPGAINRTIH